MRWLTRTLMNRSLGVQEGLGAIGSKVQESLSGIHVVKAYTIEDHEARALPRNQRGIQRAGPGARTDARRDDADDSSGTVGTLDHDRADLWRDAGARPRHFDWSIWSPSWVTSASSRGRLSRSAGRSPSTSAARASMKRLEEIFAAVPAPTRRRRGRSPRGRRRRSNGKTSRSAISPTASKP